MSPVQGYREVLPELRSAMSIRLLSILSQIIRLLLSCEYLNHKATVFLDRLVAGQEQGKKSFKSTQPKQPSQSCKYHENSY
jgi:hypothetical protein